MSFCFILWSKLKPTGSLAWVIAKMLNIATYNYARARVRHENVLITEISLRTPTQQSFYVTTEQNTLKIPLHGHASSNHPIGARDAGKRLRHATGFQTLPSAILNVAWSDTLNLDVKFKLSKFDITYF